MEIIVPAAGLSTRFPGTRPKFTLTDYEGKSMLYRSLLPYLGKFSITVGILEIHEKEYDISNFIRSELGDQVRIVILPNPTQGPAHTVYEIIKIQHSGNIQIPHLCFYRCCNILLSA